MPILTIEGRDVQVDDSFTKLSPEAQQATVEEIAASMGIKPQAAPSKEVSGLFDQFAAGLESNTELPGQTIEAFGKTAGSEGLSGAGTWLRDLTSQPKNFVSATDRFINPKQGDSYVDPLLGFGWGNLPGAAAEVGGQMVGDIAVRSAGATAGGAIGGATTAGPGAVPGAVIGGLTAPALLEFMRVAGPVAVERAKNNGREVPTWEDWQAAAATAGVSGILNAIGIKKVGVLNEGLQEVGKKTYGTVIKETATETAKKAGKEGITEAGQSVVQQTGETAGTNKGLTIDLKQAVGEGILGVGAAGTIDAGRNIRPMVQSVNDIKSVDYNTDPNARDKAEITRDVNDIAARMKGQGKDPLSAEISSYVQDLKNQISEAIKGQKLDPADQAALLGGFNTAKGLTQDRLNQIAGRSESPDEIKALARKVQLVREMTMQKQTAKGARGWAAAGASTLGGAAGAAIGGALGGLAGGAAGAHIGQNIGRDIARRLRGNQTQGNAIDSLVGAKQARRAKLMLDRYGPSDATTALNTLTEKAAANKAQADAEEQARKDFKETMDRIRYQNSMRQKSQKAMEQAKTKEEKAAAAAEKQKLDLATREERLKGMAYKAQISKARAERMASDLQARKSLDALHIEMAQARRDLEQHKVEAKAAESADKATARSKDLEGRILKLAEDIKIRQATLRKAEALAKRAEKMAERASMPKEKTTAVNRAAARNYAKMTAEQIASVQKDQYGMPINDQGQYEVQKQRIMALEADGLTAATAFPDKELGNTFIRAIRDFQTYRGRVNQDKRMAVYQNVMDEVPPGDLDAQRFIAMYIRPLAFAFEAQTGGSKPGNEDFGSSYDPGEEIPF